MSGSRYPAANAAGIPGYATSWTETFDDGLGRVGHVWGHVWVHDGMATVSSWAGEGWQPSGMMQFPGGASANQGFGLYSVTLQIQADAPGAFACLWPSSDTWPGPELDLIELDGNGNPYSTIHWKGADGADQSQGFALTGFDPREVHTYSLAWAADRLTFYVDGVRQWTTTEHVPQDAAHGGENAAFGVGQQPGWAAAYQNGDNVVNVFEMSYAAPVPSVPVGGMPKGTTASDRVWQGTVTYAGTDYVTLGAVPAWGTLVAATGRGQAPEHLAYDNFVTGRFDFRAAGPIDLMLVSLREGSVRTGGSADRVTWVAHSDDAEAGNTMRIATGAGNDLVTITAAGVSPLADIDRRNNGDRYDGEYDGRWSDARVTLGAGRDTLLAEAAHATVTDFRPGRDVLCIAQPAEAVAQRQTSDGLLLAWDHGSVLLAGVAALQPQDLVFV